MKSKIQWVILFIFTMVILEAQPPEPPLGQRWVLNEKFSDEFNGTALDTAKWYDYHPNWRGRPPGLFLPSTVKVENGYMSIQGGKLDHDTIIRNDTFNIACGAVVSKSQEAWFGYYECRFKAAATTMSTTFWFSSRRHFDGPEDCRDSYGLEWDVQECIGREGDFKGNFFASGMHSNSHFWYRDCERESHDYRAEQVLFESNELASENFNTYGGWWKNEYEASYYFNNGEAKSHTFFTDIKEKPFDHPLGMNLVSETYPFPWISLPTDEELNDDSRNTCYYDWVRAYTLVDVDQAVKNSGETFMFAEELKFLESSEGKAASKTLDFVLSYMANGDRELILELYTPEKELLVSQKYAALAGNGKKKYAMNLASIPEPGSEYEVKAHIVPIGASPDESFQTISHSLSILNP